MAANDGPDAGAASRGEKKRREERFGTVVDVSVSVSVDM